MSSTVPSSSTPSPSGDLSPQLPRPAEPSEAGAFDPLPGGGAADWRELRARVGEFLLRPESFDDAARQRLVRALSALLAEGDADQRLEAAACLCRLGPAAVEALPLVEQLIAAELAELQANPVGYPDDGEDLLAGLLRLLGGIGPVAVEVLAPPSEDVWRPLSYWQHEQRLYALRRLGPVGAAVLLAERRRGELSLSDALGWLEDMVLGAAVAEELLELCRTAGADRPSPMIEALGHLPSTCADAAVGAMFSLLATERRSVHWAAQDLGSAALPALLRQADSADVEFRRTAVEILVGLEEPLPSAVRATLLRDADPRVRVLAARLEPADPPEVAVPVLREVLAGPYSAEPRHQAARQLSRLADEGRNAPAQSAWREAAEPWLREQLTAAEPSARLAALEGLLAGRVVPTETLTVLSEVLATAAAEPENTDRDAATRSALQRIVQLDQLLKPNVGGSRRPDVRPLDGGSPHREARVGGGRGRSSAGSAARRR